MHETAIQGRSAEKDVDIPVDKNVETADKNDDPAEPVDNHSEPEPGRNVTGDLFGYRVGTS